MKKALPQNAKIAKDAKETVQECVSEFISFITSEYVKIPCISEACTGFPPLPPYCVPSLFLIALGIAPVAIS